MNRNTPNFISSDDNRGVADNDLGLVIKPRNGGRKAKVNLEKLDSS